MIAAGMGGCECSCPLPYRISWQHPPHLHCTHARGYTQPLYMGSPHDPVALSKLYAEERRQLASPLHKLLARPKHPTLTFRAGPLPPAGGAGGAAAAWRSALCAPLAALPGTLVAGPEVASALGAWRLAAAGALACGGDRSPLQGGGEAAPGGAAVVADAALAAFVRVCGDPDVLDLFLEKWHGALQELRAAKQAGRGVGGRRRFPAAIRAAALGALPCGVLPRSMAKVG